MFYDNYIRLCNSINKAPSAVALEIGISKPTVNRWKNGSNPTDATLVKIAEYFGTTTDELLGVETKKAPAPKGEREYSDLELIEAVMRADEQTREVIRLILERK